MPVVLTAVQILVRQHALVLYDADPDCRTSSNRTCHTLYAAPADVFIEERLGEAYINHDADDMDDRQPPSAFPPSGNSEAARPNSGGGAADGSSGSGISGMQSAPGAMLDSVLPSLDHEHEYPQTSSNDEEPRNPTKQTQAATQSKRFFFTMVIATSVEKAGTTESWPG